MQHKPKQIDYGVREFDLSDARENQRIPVDAESLTVLRSEDTAEIRLGSPNAPAIPTRDLGTMEIPERFQNIYLSNDAGTGTLRLLLGMQGITSSVQASGDQVDVTDRGARELGKARVQDSGGVLIDPFVAEDVSQRSDQTNTAGTWVSVSLGDARSGVDIAADVSGAGTLTVEVSATGQYAGEEHTVQTIEYDAAGVQLEQFSFAYEHVRASVDANLNDLEIVGRAL